MDNRVIRYGPMSCYILGKFTIVRVKIDGTAYVLNTDLDTVHKVFANEGEAIRYVQNYKEVPNG